MSPSPSATGALTALIGANGAGKSTTLLTLSGLLRPRSGRAVLRGADGGAVELTRAAPERIVRAGVVHCPEGRQIFRSLTVAENLAMGAYTRDDPAAVRDEIAGIHALFPLLADRGAPAGGHAVGRRADDAGDRPRPAWPAAASAARRAVARAGAAGGRDDLRRDRRVDRAGGHHSADRAECGDGAGDRRPGLRDGERPHRALGHRCKPRRGRPGAAGLPGGARL